MSFEAPFTLDSSSSASDAASVSEAAFEQSTLLHSAGLDGEFREMFAGGWSRLPFFHYA